MALASCPRATAEPSALHSRFPKVSSTGRGAAVEDLVGDAVGEGAGLAGAGTGDDQEGAGGGRGGVLVGIQAVEDGSGDG